jgi:energy-coupling factor transporter ATP-binding protein EcfA2
LFGSLSLRENIAVAAPDHAGENPALALFSSRAAARDEEAAQQSAEAMLAQFGLTDRATSTAARISLGQSKRLAIARAVAAGARILFLDEPLAGLDRRGIADVVPFLNALVLERRLTLVIVEHVLNHEHLEGVTTTDWLFQEGKIVPAAVPRASQSRPSTLDVGGNSLSGAAAQIAKYNCAPGWNPVVSHEPLRRGARLTRIRRRHASPTPDATLKIRNLVVLLGTRAVFDPEEDGEIRGFDLTLNEGEVAIVEAPNGWGKTTLVKTLAGLLPAQSGRIALSGRHVVPAADDLMGDLTVAEQLHLACVRGETDLLRRLGHQLVSSLSGGERQLLALATARTAPSALVTVFDEPFASLDAKAIAGVLPFLMPDSQSSVLILLPGATL